MKKIILILMLAQSAGICVGQTTDSTRYRNSIDLDVTLFVKNIFNLSSNNTVGSGPYLLTYRRSLSEKNNLRLGVDFYMYDSDTQHENDDSFTDSYFSYTIGAGYERLSSINKRWTAYFGADLMYEYYTDDQKTVNGSFVEKRYVSQQTANVAPLAGLVFHLNKRLSLSTEAMFLFTYSKRSITETTAYFPPKKETRTFYGTGFISPALLRLRCAF